MAILINSLSYLFMISLFKNYIVNIIFYFVDVYSDSTLSAFCHIFLAFESSLIFENYLNNNKITHLITYAKGMTRYHKIYPIRADANFLVIYLETV